ncbi:MAG: hypothetical protein IJ456_01510 [Bacteroides sp.]|nr:hypothetical protein [Bacteroides sp.]
MKTLKNIFSVLFACIAVAGFWSCDDEVEYTPAEAPTTDQVFFPSSLGSNYDLTLDATSFTIEVQRVASESAATVALSVSDESGKLSIPTSVDFAAGAKTATLTIGYNPEDFEYDVYTKVNISIAESYATPYGNSAYTFTVGVPAPWTDWELMNTGTYTFTQYYSGTHEGRNCYVRTYKLNENIKQFRFEDLAGAYTYVVDHDASTGKCTIAPQHIFDNDSYGAVYIASSHTYWFDVRGDETATEEAVGASTFDPETGLFSLNVAYYVSAGTFGYGYEYFQLDGYTQPDYTLSLTEAGHYLAPDGTDNMVFHVQKGADVVSYKYISVEGKLNSNDASAKISGIIDGSIEAEEATESGYLAFAFPTAGEYSVVVVGLTKQEKQ